VLFSCHKRRLSESVTAARLIQKKGFLYRMDIEKDNLAINEKYNLTIKEAVKYFNIGEKNLRRLVSNNPNADYILT
jgi:hypothetical protein